MMMHPHQPPVNQQEGHSGSSTGISPDATHGAASMLISKVADLMALSFKAGQLLTDPPFFSDLCLSLAKGMDHAIANNEVPIGSRDLPPLLKKVLASSDHFTQALASSENFSARVGLMMLTLSIQSACKRQWFPNQDTDDLLLLSERVMQTFSDPEHICIEPTDATGWTLKVMSRFYPNMKIDQIIFSLELEPGHRFYVAGFPIIRGTVAPKKEKIYLLVAQMDNLRTSACIITPPEVNFILNGHEVEGRVLESMDKMPQLPTNVTAKLKYGVNCLQAIGKFNGNFLVVIAVMSNTQSPNALELPDYVRPAALIASEAQTMEMSTRISLNCPISESRIKTPVKGKLCAHLQCFDYDNFLEINSKRPSWQCPHCKQPVCYLDLRIDQNVVKVLREADKKVVNVIISANGSWKEGNNHSSEMYGHSQVRIQGEQQNHESSSRITITSLQNHNRTISAAGTSVPNRNFSSNLLRSALSSEASVSDESHDNSCQLLQSNSSLHAQDSVGDTCTIRPFKQQNQHNWSLIPNLNTREFLINTENVFDGSIPVQVQPIERSATIQTPSIVHEAVGPFPLASRTSSGLNSPAVVDEARVIIKEELQQVDIDEAAHALPIWRPTKRMRGGSLNGEAYSAAFHQFTTDQPALRSQVSRPASVMVPTPSNPVSARGSGHSANNPSGS